MNEQQTKAFMGKLLGEVYRIQRHLGLPNGPSKGEIYGLLNGVEYEIDKQLEHIGFVTTQQLEAADNILNEHDQREAKLDDHSGVYGLERELGAAGIGRGEAMVIYKYFKANGSFQSLIERLNRSSHAPSELQDSSIDSDI